MARVVNKPRLEPETKPAEKENKQSKRSNTAEYLSRQPSYSLVKEAVGNILLSEDYEEILTDMIDKLLKDEQMALTEESKREIKLEKRILGSVLSDVVAYGDQQGLLYLLTDRLGYKRKY